MSPLKVNKNENSLLLLHTISHVFGMFLYDCPCGCHTCGYYCEFPVSSAPAKGVAMVQEKPNQQPKSLGFMASQITQGIGISMNAFQMLLNIPGNCSAPTLVLTLIGSYRGSCPSCTARTIAAVGCR